SLALAGHPVRREDVAAALLNAFEPMWTEHEEGDRGRVIEAWSRHARFWGETVAVRTPRGLVRGRALRLDEDGALLLATPGGTTARVLAGDVERERAPDPAPEGGDA